MARKFSGGVDCTGQQILNVREQNLASAPSSPGAGQRYYDTVKKASGFYNGSVWVYPTETAGAPEASSTVLGTIMTKGDLAGTGTSPKVASLSLTGDTAVNHKLTELTTPTAGKDAANKEYVDGKIPVAATSSTLGTIETKGDLGGSGTAPTVVHFTLTSNSAAGGFKITGLGEPEATGDAATKAYVDAKANGIAWKQPVVAATTEALPAVTAAGTGATHTLTANANGILEVDGIKLETVGQRVLVKNQAAAKDNGIYTLTTAGTASVKFVLTRAADAATEAQLTQATVLVEDGTVNADHAFNQITDPAFTVDTTALEWTEIQSGTAVKGDGTYITRVANTIEILPETTVPAEPAEGAVEPGSNGVARKKVFRLRGKSGTTKYVCTHSLNTRLLCVQGMEMSGENPTVPIELDWEVTSANAVEITLPLALAGTVNYAVTIVG